MGRTAQSKEVGAKSVSDQGTDLKEGFHAHLTLEHRQAKQLNAYDQWLFGVYLGFVWGSFRVCLLNQYYLGLF